MFAKLQSAYHKITVTFIVLAELRTVPQISILVHTDLEPRDCFTNPLASY